MAFIPSFHLMAKPTGAVCNLNCSYCYFLDNNNVKKSGRMTKELQEIYIKQLIDAHSTSQVTIAWQGGEPTLMGLEFFKRSVRLAEKNKKSGMVVEHTIQTNGTLLDDEWCTFFSENHYLVGLSLDGPKKYHDIYRKNKNGDSVFDKVESSVRLLQKHKVDFNILATVNAGNVNYPLEVYKYFRDDLRVQHIHFIPIVEREGNNVANYSVKSGQYGKFLSNIFDEWVKNDVGEIFVQMFDNSLASWVGVSQSACVFSPTCGTSLIMMHDGNVYSCDHFCQKEYLLGNIKETKLSGLVSSDQQIQFGQDKENTLSKKCRNCDFRFACHGGCPKNKFNGQNYLCEDYQFYFSHIDRKMKEMSQLLREGKNAEDIIKNKN